MSGNQRTGLGILEDKKQSWRWHSPIKKELTFVPATMDIWERGISEWNLHLILKRWNVVVVTANSHFNIIYGKKLYKYIT